MKRTLDVGSVEEDGEGSGSASSSEAGGNGPTRSGADGSTAERGVKQTGRKRSQVVLSDGRVVSCKVRNHVNPLHPHFQKPVLGPANGDWSKVFADLEKPLVMDVGSAKGRFCLEGAKRCPEFNWLGLEIREPLVARANEWVKEQNLGNLHYIFGNANAGIAGLLDSMPSGFLQRVTIQCPDPLFKKKHQKRRMVTDRLIAELADHMRAGSVLFVQSDVEQVAMQMVDTIAAAHKFERVTALPTKATEDGVAIAPVARPRPIDGGDYHDTAIGGGDWEHKGAGAEEDGSYQWLSENPLGLMSERESATLSRGLPMYRALFQRCVPP
mmetsp:Transcript_10174/g.23077  ORF Transcript_10174/g.23077 Transcript_10174/m.23077 type:complete len:326 (-) Transcript_10174:60-1037(-)